MNDALAATYPRLAARFRKLSLADLPTPVTQHTLTIPGATHDIAIKHDGLTSRRYGGNKVRKLEYLLQRAIERGARRVATFGAVGSNHALATAIHAADAGLDCTCFLSHQRTTPSIAPTLRMHQQLGTELVYWGRNTSQRDLMRRYLQGRNTWVIPLGGSCWLGSLGFVAAGLELAQQVQHGELRKPDRIYVAAGTTGTVAGLALGLAAAGLDTQIQAVRVADEPFGGPDVLRRLIDKTATVLRRVTPDFPPAAESHTRCRWRDDFLAGGYARVDDPTREAVALAAEQFGLRLESTYTGKAMAALLHDLRQVKQSDSHCLFWNTCNSTPLSAAFSADDQVCELPANFKKYLDNAGL